ncbi:hypothetical protein MD484_g8893, partial [Candolleomyces efflorescens]
MSLQDHSNAANPFSDPPILRLANETLIQIFDYAVHLPVLAGPVTLDSAEHISSLYDELNHFAPPTALHQTEGEEEELDDDDDDEYTPSISSHATHRTTPLLLSHVCKTWRRLTFSAPELWSTIYINGISPRMFMLLQKIWLPNSRTRLLDLTIQGPNLSLSSVRKVSVKEVFRALGKESARWRSLTVKSSVPWGFSLHELFCPVGPAAHLESFSIYAASSWLTPSADKLVKGFATLRHVELTKTGGMNVDCTRFIVGLSPAHLTTLKLPLALESRSHTRLFTTLSRFGCLEALQVEFTVLRPGERLHSGRGLLEEVTVHLPVMKKLTLIGTHGSHESLISLLNSLDAPSLSDLSIRTRFPPGGDRSLAGILFTSLKEMLTRSKVALRTFTFVDANNDLHLYPLLTHPSISTIEELEVRSTHMSILLERLKIEDSETPVEWIALPNLVHLRLALYDYRPAFCALSKMVKSRQGVSPCVRKIRSVEATFCDRDQMRSERKFWDEQRELEGVERWFYYRS